MVDATRQPDPMARTKCDGWAATDSPLRSSQRTGRHRGVPETGSPRGYKGFDFAAGDIGAGCGSESVIDRSTPTNAMPSAML